MTNVATVSFCYNDDEDLTWYREVRIFEEETGKIIACYFWETADIFTDAAKVQEDEERVVEFCRIHNVERISVVYGPSRVKSQYGWSERATNSEESPTHKNGGQEKRGDLK